MNVCGRLLCMILCISMLLSLVGCSQANPEPTQATAPPTEIPTEETQVTVDSYLAIAQGFIDKEDFDSAIAVLEQAKGIAEDARIDDMLAQIEELRSIPLDVVVSQESPDPEGGTVQIHSVTAVQRHDGFVRYTIDYTATEGMYIQLEGPGLSYTSNFSTTGTRDTFEFEISTSDLRAIGRKFRLFFSISRNDLLCLSLLTNWPGDALTAAIPLTLQQGDLTAIYGCEIHSVTVQAVDEERLYYSVDYTAPRAGMPISVQLGDQEPTVLRHTDTGRRQFAFLLEREDVKAADRILLRIQESEGSNSGASVDLSDHTLPEKENSTPVKEISNLSFVIYNRLSDGESYQIHNISAQLLASGFVRYSIEYTAREGITSWAYGFISGTTKGYPMVIGREASGTAEIYLTIEDLHSSQETICVFSGVHPMERYEVNIFHIWNNASTEGVPVGDPISLPFALEEEPKSDAYSFQSCVAQPLSNDYVRLTFSFTAPENRLCYARDLPAFFHIPCGTGNQAGKQTVTLDIPADTSLYNDILRFCVNMLGSQQDGRMFVAIDVSDVLGVDVATAKIFVNIVHPQLNTQTAAS